VSPTTGPAPSESQSPGRYKNQGRPAEFRPRRGAALKVGRRPYNWRVPRDGANPTGVWVASAFFAIAGVLEVGLAVWEAPHPMPLATLWEASGRGLLHLLLAWGLWRRIALCRSVAMVYCLAMLVTYAAVLLLAAQAPVRFPTSVIVKSVYEVPSCALLLPYLRSAEASLLFRRPLFGG
jgi:hypothetical protein